MEFVKDAPNPKNAGWFGQVSGIQARDHYPGSDTVATPESRNPLAVNWHGRSLNDHNYAETLTQDKAVFRYAPLPTGPMADILKSHDKTTQSKQEPRGRTRTDPGFFQDGWTPDPPMPPPLEGFIWKAYDIDEPREVRAPDGSRTIELVKVHVMAMVAGGPAPPGYKWETVKQEIEELRQGPYGPEPVKLLVRVAILVPTRDPKTVVHPTPPMPGFTWIPHVVEMTEWRVDPNRPHYPPNPVTQAYKVMAMQPGGPPPSGYKWKFEAQKPDYSYVGMLIPTTSSLG